MLGVIGVCVTVLQCVAVSILQCVAVCSGVLLQWDTGQHSRSMLIFAAMCTCYLKMRRRCGRHPTPHCNAQHTACTVICAASLIHAHSTTIYCRRSHVHCKRCKRARQRHQSYLQGPPLSVVYRACQQRSRIRGGRRRRRRRRRSRRRVRCADICGRSRRARGRGFVVTSGDSGR